LNDTLNRTVRIAGIVNTNEKVVTQANKNFRGLTDYIGGNYTKFAKPTE
jgi:hypothetical protein